MFYFLLKSSFTFSLSSPRQKPNIRTFFFYQLVRSLHCKNNRRLLRTLYVQVRLPTQVKGLTSILTYEIIVFRVEFRLKNNTVSKTS